MANQSGQSVSNDYYNRISEAVESITQDQSSRTSIAILTGTGIGLPLLAKSAHRVIPYADIRGFPVPTAPSHEGCIYLSKWGTAQVALFSGRFHAYEGLSLRDVTFPIRVMKAMGAEVLVLLNASGSVSEVFESGSLALITDHINFMQDNPLIGPNDQRLGPRFPDMSQVYDLELQSIAHSCADRLGISLHDAVYLALRGPSLETRAEYAMIKTMGADLVGMSTVPEAIVARHADMRVLGLSVVSNQVAWDQPPQKTTIQEVIEVVNSAQGTLESLLMDILLQLEKSV